VPLFRHLRLFLFFRNALSLNHFKNAVNFRGSLIQFFRVFSVFFSASTFARLIFPVILYFYTTPDKKALIFAPTANRENRPEL